MVEPHAQIDLAGSNSYRGNHLVASSSPSTRSRSLSALGCLGPLSLPRLRRSAARRVAAAPGRHVRYRIRVLPRADSSSGCMYRNPPPLFRPYRSELERPRHRGRGILVIEGTGGQSPRSGTSACESLLLRSPASERRRTSFELGVLHCRMRANKDMYNAQAIYLSEHKEKMRRALKRHPAFRHSKLARAPARNLRKYR